MAAAHGLTAGIGRAAEGHRKGPGGPWPARTGGEGGTERDREAKSVHEASAVPAAPAAPPDGPPAGVVR